MVTQNQATRSPPLKRALNLPLLTLYGLGTTVGAGIYALIGEIAAVAGYGAPVSFLIASAVAAFTACSFAELSARYPRAAGAALYVQEGLHATRLSLFVGLMVVASGLVSSAALLNAFHGYLAEFIALDRATIMIVATLILGALAAWGIMESVIVAALITVVEIGGILFVIALSGDALATLPARWTEFAPSTEIGWAGILVGVTLAFYAYIGFEDMVDVAEETRNVRHNLPRAILLTIGITTLLYLTLMVSALLTLSPSALAATGAPMAALYEAHTQSEPTAISIIAMFAIVNGALIQLVMVSRVLYGLSSRAQIPVWFGQVNPVTRTPLRATGFAAAILIGLALTGKLAGLAATTSLIMLTIFTLVNISLWNIKRKEVTAPDDMLTFPIAVPIIGALASAAFALREILNLLL